MNRLHPYCILTDSSEPLLPRADTVPPLNILSSLAKQPWFTATEIAKIYRIPPPTTANVVVGVISFGGGLYGSIDRTTGVLTNGDVQAYWSAIGIPVDSMPTVVVVPINGAKNDLSDNGSTVENTIDVETIGGCCPSPNLTIILYISPNSFDDFYKVFQYTTSIPVMVNGVGVKPTIYSISWGAPEIYFTKYSSPSMIPNVTALFSQMTAAGVNICTATGDYGSNNGVGGSGSYTDFPASNPYVTAVGGTRLVCPTIVYLSQTTSETAWSSGGGAVSVAFPRPSYQATASPNTTGRSIPDISSDSDPNTGMIYIINGATQVVGGTSIAAPTIAAFLAAINATRFINPLLYTAPSICFHDTLSGNNGAFSAKAGYDNCTGLGSISGASLAAHILGTPPVLATGLSVSPSTLSVLLRSNQTSQLVANIIPITAANMLLSWTTTNAAIATVNVYGLVSIKGVGSTTIKATTTDGSNLVASCVVTVVASSVTSVTVNTMATSIQVGQTTQMTGTVIPSTATNKILTWTSSNTAVATVSTSGQVTAVSVGTTMVAATASNGVRSVSVPVTVRPPLTVAVTRVILSTPAILQMANRTSVQSVATIIPTNATNKAVTWTTSNSAIATVSSTGLIRAVGKTGTALATITARSVNGNTMATTIVRVV